MQPNTLTKGEHKDKMSVMNIRKKIMYDPKQDWDPVTDPKLTDTLSRIRIQIPK
jgi:hypothetical protein